MLTGWQLGNINVFPLAIGWSVFRSLVLQEEYSLAKVSEWQTLTEEKPTEVSQELVTGRLNLNFQKKKSGENC